MSIELEKYKGQSTRYTCPKCGRKHSFTRYIDTETNIYIDEKVGICNRAIK
ncbi:MAG: PG0870-related protein [Bacteroidales bacterium]